MLDKEYEDLKEQLEAISVKLLETQAIGDELKQENDKLKQVEGRQSALILKDQDDLQKTVSDLTKDLKKAQTLNSQLTSSKDQSDSISKV